MRVIPFYRHHLNGFQPQPRQLGVLGAQDHHLKALEEGYSFSVIGADGAVLAVGGMAAIWEGRWTAWCALSVLAAPHILALTRIARRELAKFDDQRVEASTQVDFPEGDRWLRMLGFECEVPIAKRLVPGQTLGLYVRA